MGPLDKKTLKRLREISRLPKPERMTRRTFHLKMESLHICDTFFEILMWRRAYEISQGARSVRLSAPAQLGVRNLLGSEVRGRRHLSNRGYSRSIKKISYPRFDS